MNNEIREKDRRIRGFLEQKGLDGILLSRVDDFAWATGGKSSFCNKFSEEGVVTLLITKEKKYVISSYIESYRIMDEELDGLGYELVLFEWYKGNGEVIDQLTKGLKVASDNNYMGIGNLYGEFKEMRFSLTEEEVAKARALCKTSAKAMDEVCRELQQGDTEFEIAANLTYKLMSKGVEVPVALVASDERIFKYRHPIPTGKKVENYVMVVVCARQYGLVISLTRFVHFGALSQEIKDKYKACLNIDATTMFDTIPGTKVSDIFEKLTQTYEEQGYEGEWKLHHQGGPAGYDTREYVATPYADGKVVENQLYAWNPSITGVKSEDTILVTNNGFEILTEIDGWPIVGVVIGDKKVGRPDILIK